MRDLIFFHLTYFRSKSFSLFTVCNCYQTNDGKLEKIAITVTQQEIENLITVLIFHVSKAIAYSIPFQTAMHQQLLMLAI